MSTSVTLLHFEDCPSWQLVARDLEALSEELDLDVERRLVDTPEAAERWRFRGSPTILVEGSDVFASGEEPFGLSCRVFQTPEGPSGAPTRQQLRDAIVAAPGSPGRPQLDEIDAALAAATPELDATGSALALAIYRRLAAGAPARLTELAADIGATSEDVEERLGSWVGVFRDEEGAVVGFWGLALPEMGHRITFDGGPTVHAWCAWDPLFIAPLVGPATVETPDRVTGETISYRVGPDGIEGASEDHVVSFLDPGDGWEEDVIATFCHHVLHFEDGHTGRRWTADRPDTFLLSLDEAAELGRRHADRIAGESVGLRR